MDGDRKKCKICLIRDIDPEKYINEIKRLIDHLPLSEKSSAGEYEARLDKCSECSYLKDGFCMACGCYVELRAAKRNGNCPYKHW